MIRRAVDSWVKRADAPFLMYFHVWELDPDQPRILAAPWTERVRQYRNLHKMPEIVRFYLGNYRFQGSRTISGCRTVVMLEAGCRGKDEPSAVHFVADQTPVTIVVPCFNEELILPYLANTLKSVERAIRDRYDLRFIFVDDGSADGTWAALKRSSAIGPIAFSSATRRTGASRRRSSPGSIERRPRSSVRSTVTAPTIPCSSKRCCRF